jgi:predicted HTH transcriptional regulator
MHEAIFNFSEIKRKDVWSIPLTMLREVIINALVHADYSQIGAPIRVSFFDDQIEVENPGILLSGISQGFQRFGTGLLPGCFGSWILSSSGEPGFPG